jgi:predicted GH43/DUF377 family glycosyl hydrolase
VKDLVLRSSSNPLITVLDLPYQANAVFNAGAVDLGEDVLLLLRVESCSGRSHLIAARSRDGVSEWRVEETALLHPSQGFPYESNGVEDCRITWMENLDAWGIAYTTFSAYGPGVAIATTRDFRSVERIGMVLPPEDKNAALFPCKFDGLYAMFHRPSNAGGAIWISYSPDLVFWGKAEMVVPARGGPWWDATRVGVGLPPIRTEAGWLVIYHGVKEVAGGPIYRLGAALLDLDEPHRLIGRTRRWLMSPQALYERIGDAPNVIFTSGGFVRDDTLWIYYGAADSCICLATVGVTDILRLISSESDE